MGRPRLTDEEREARRKERSAHSFSNNSYKHYDTSKGFGSMDEWVRIAEMLVDGKLVMLAGVSPDKDLELLNLSEMPDTLNALKKAYRNSLFMYHPDHGGTAAAAIAAREAFERLSKNYK